ncbi:MAG: NTP transferase domain-containing protein [Acidimicrobiia bacterium]|nr:NTP transferase domain-containing protein [Acidimicrobiia bacterium]
MKAPPSVAVVLAAGAGRRFDGTGHKLEADAGGLPVVVRSVAAAAAAGFDHTVVVWGAVPLRPILSAYGQTRSVRTVFNPCWADGLAAAHRLGVDAADALGYRSVVVGLGDMPAVTPEDWQAVARCADSPVVVTRWADGHLSPPVRIQRDVWGLLPATGDIGTRFLWSARDSLLVTQIERGGSGQDVDTVADLDAVADRA